MFEMGINREGKIFHLTDLTIQDIFTPVQNLFQGMRHLIRTEWTGDQPSTAGIKTSITTWNHIITMKIVINPQAAMHSQGTTHQEGSQLESTETIIITILLVIIIIMIIIITILVIIITILVIIITILEIIIIIMMPFAAIMIAVTIILIIMQAIIMTITGLLGTKRGLTDMITWRELDHHPLGTIAPSGSAQNPIRTTELDVINIHECYRRFSLRVQCWFYFLQWPTTWKSLS